MNRNAMNRPELPSTLPNPERLSDMLSGVGTSFRSGEAYDAARAAGHDVSERTLRTDLTAAADAGILERTGSGAWKRTSEPDELRLRIACALLSAGSWKYPTVVNGPPFDVGRQYEGPTPEGLKEAVNEYAEALEQWG
jgi:hypothetical protein